MKLSIKAGTTSKSIKIFVQDSSVTTGAGLTGLVFNTASLVAYYIKEGDASSTVINLVTATLGTWTSGGFIVVDGTNMPGLYELSLPNAVIASGKSVVVLLRGATNMVPVVLEIELTATDNQDATNGGLSNVGTILDVLQGDESISKADATQYNQVIKKKSTSIVLVQKKLYKSDGSTKVNADTDIVGQRSES